MHVCMYVCMYASKRMVLPTGHPVVSAAWLVEHIPDALIERSFDFMIEMDL